MNILTIVGARPQFVKAAAVSRAIIKKGNIKEKIVHTGQHYDENMSEIFFKEMEIPQPHYNLRINGTGHGAMTGKMIEGLEAIMLKEKPDYVLIYGDTNSTLAGAISAAKIHIPIAHVESGLRSFNMRMPEEINRIVSDRLSSLLFCPTHHAINNLNQEGYENFPSKVIFTGDVMFDAALYYREKSADRSNIMKEHMLYNENYVLVTIHRAENTDNLENFKAILNALQELSKERKIVFPLHPRTRNLIQKYDLDTSGVKLIDPLGYFDMLQAIQNAKLIITDSGGLQKEAYFFGKPCITTRNETEWTELVDNGYNILTGADSERITEAYRLMSKKTIHNEKNLYGKGDASDKIVEALAYEANKL